MLGTFDYEYGDEGVGTLAEDVDIDLDGFFLCSRCGESLYHNETHDCIECAHCGEHDGCICDELDYDIFEEYNRWNALNT